MLKLVPALAILFCLGHWDPAHAQDPVSLPDPATIEVPDLSNSGNSQVIRNGWKYFFFRKDGVSFEAAHADFSDCFRYLKPTGWGDVMLPSFVAWNKPEVRKAEYDNGNAYGLVGALILSMVEGTLTRRDYQSKMRRCMETRDYVRYGVDEEIWENVVALPPDESIPILAKIASGPDFGGKVPVK